MDLSKLPKLSEKPREADPSTQASANTDTPAPAPGDYEPKVAEPGGPEAWISAAMGVLLLMMNPRFVQWLLSPGTMDAKWKFTTPQGGPLTYTKTIFFWNDLAITAFCIVLIFDAIVLLKARNPLLVMVAFGFTVVTVLGNLAYLLATFNTYGLPLMSAIAIAYGGYIAIYEWRLLQLLKR